MADYKPDHQGIGELMRSPEIHGLVDLAAYEAVPFAKAISPDATPKGEGYVASFEVHPNLTRKLHGVRTRRAVAELGNNSDHAIIVENGLDQNMGHHVLGRTIDFIERG